MSAYSLLQIGLYLAALVLLVKPLGWYMARVYEGQPCGLDRIIGWLERGTYRLCGIDPGEEMSWVKYAQAMLAFNSMHDSYTPLGGLVPLWLMHLGEVVFGGVGSGLYGMLAFAIIAVFIAGLMVGHTPEYLGKKIEAFEMKMAALVVLRIQ